MRNSSIRFAAVSLLLAGASFSNAATPIPLVNGGFEASSDFLGGPTPFVTTIAGWRVEGVGNGGDFSQIQGVTGQPATGKEGNNFSYNVRGVFQTLDTNRVSITVGEDYTLSFLAEADFDGIASSNLISLDWYNSTSGYTPLSSSSTLVSIAENGFFVSYTLNAVTAPVGATHLGVRFDSTNAALGGTGANIWLDGVTLTSIPEPSAVSILMGASCLTLTLRRRKRI